MKSPVNILLLIRYFLFAGLLCIPAYAGDAGSPVLTEFKNTVIINEVPDTRDASSDALVNYIDYRTIMSRAKSMKLNAVEDAAPYIDNTAFFLLHPRIEIPVTGLEKGKNYNILIDFVRYRGKKINIDGQLKIFIKDEYGNEQMICTADHSLIYSDKIFKTEIPFNLSYSGNFTIIIHEYSMKTGNWGIWDIIVTSKSISGLGVIKPETTPGLKDSGTKIFQ